jgi:hypothetical protein
MADLGVKIQVIGPAGPGVPSMAQILAALLREKGVDVRLQHRNDGIGAMQLDASQRQAYLHAVNDLGRTIVIEEKFDA